MSTDRELYADAKAENECFEAGHPLNGDRCACGVVARAIRHRTCRVCSGRIYPDDHVLNVIQATDQRRTVTGSPVHAECWNQPKDAA